MDNLKLNVDVKKFFDSDTTIYEFDKMLLGRWHSSFDSSTNGAKKFDDMILQEFDLNNLSNKNILDFGCGIGTTLIEYAKKYPNHNFYGLNISKKQIDICKNKSKNIKNIKFIYYGGKYLPFSNNFFDVIYSFEAICYVENKNSIFYQFKQKLKPNGILVILDWNINTYNQKNKYLIDSICRGFDIPSLLSVEQYEKMLNFNGFHITHKGYLDEIHKSIDDNNFNNDGLNIIEEEYTFSNLIKNIGQLVHDGFYRLNLYRKYYFKINNIEQIKLEKAYNALNDASSKGYFKIGFIKAFNYS